MKLTKDSRYISEFQCDLVLQSGDTLTNARLVYATYGHLNERADNVILFPTRFGATHEANEFLIGPGCALDTDRYHVLVPNLLGNGVSSSPSNQAAPLDGPRFPPISILDNVILQQRMLEEVFGVDRLALVLGWSMGALQAYQWGNWYPAAVDRLMILCGCARTSDHNIVFLESLRAALQADSRFSDGNYKTPPVAGMRAIGRIYAGWAYSQDWYRARLYRDMGFATLSDYLAGYWDTLFTSREPNDVMTMIDTWINHDISANERFHGDLSMAIAAIDAPTVLMPCTHDLYFRVEENQVELADLVRGELSPLDSIWGHMAASGQNSQDNALISKHIRHLLSQPHKS